jgi:hypothetical protein
MANPLINFPAKNTAFGLDWLWEMTSTVIPANRST